MNNVISLQTRQPVETPPPPPLRPHQVRYRTCLELPVKRTVSTREELADVIPKVICDVSEYALRNAETVTAREAAKLYLEARRHGILITPEAMPQVRATTLGWLDRWTNEFGTTFPITAFLPFIVKGKGRS